MLKKIISGVAVTVLSVSISANVQAATITVQKGDTLWNLSRANNTTVENIKTLNDLTSDLIHPGDVLTISQHKNYTIKQGDTLWDIALEHHVTVSQIKEWNQLHTDLIHPGLSLLIYEDINTTKTAITENSMMPEAQESKEIIVEATAYTASCEGCSGITSTGINLKENPSAKIISVDPTIIPLGSKVYVEGYGEAIAGDTGGAIKGNRIDVFIPSQQDAINFGVKQLKVTILN
ncbi:LysM peptidoglycan-binding domain-containing protein [Robertmurraya sp. P23]|uniref:3D domain-containing protein n=1 Tax=Robertmurraya sp. P23 TaxID=3436931 RepID=UPI003D970557